MGCSLIEETSRNINYHTIIDLGKDGIAYETVIMSMPYSVANYSIWVDTTSVISLIFFNVIEAIENQSARFEHWRVETDLTQQQVSSLTRNLFFISLLGLIAPILAFLLTYFIMRTTVPPLKII